MRVEDSTLPRGESKEEGGGNILFIFSGSFKKKAKKGPLKIMWMKSEEFLF